MSTEYSIKAVIQAVDNFSPGMKRMAASMDAFGKQASRIGRGMTTNMSLPIAAFGGLTLKTAVDFEASMNKVEALSQESGAGLSAMRNLAQKMGATTAFSATEAAGAMSFLAQAGWKSNQILGATPGLLSLAAASQSDLARTADIASNIMGQFSINAGDASRVADVLAATTSSANVDLEMMAQSLKSAGPIAKKYGLTLENTAAAIGLMGNVGIQGEVAGTALKNTMLAMVNPAGEAGKMLNWLGVQTKSAEGDMLPLVDVLASFGTALDGAGIGEGQKLQAIQTLFGKEGLAGATELLAQAQSGALKQYADSLSDVEGRARSMAETMNKGAPGAVKNLMSAFEGLQLAIANSGLLEWFTQAAQGLTGIVRSLSETNPGFLKLGTVIAGVAAVAGPAIWAIGQMATGFSAVIGVVTKLSALMLANPILLAVAGIATAVYVIYDNWDGIVDWFDGKFEAIKSAFSDGLLNGLWTAWKEFNPITLMFEAFDGLIEYLTGFDISGYLLAQFQSVADGLPDWMKDMMGIGGVAGAGGQPPPENETGSKVDRIVNRQGGRGRDARAKVDVNINGLPAGSRVESETAGAGLDLGVGQGYAFARLK